jgi:hypothetical protein
MVVFYSKKDFISLTGYINFDWVEDVTCRICILA